MKTTEASTAWPVVIAGAGPIGLALAAYLGQRGVRTLLVERREEKPDSAKMIVVSVRTMEFCRHLGIAPEVRDWGFPKDHGLDSVFVTAMQGFELGRVRTPPLSVECDSPFSPERERPCPQTWFDPILKQALRRHESVTLRYRTALESFEQDEDGVDLTLLAADGRRESIRASYLVGADGYSSNVRELLGVQVRGNKHLDTSMSVYVRIPDLHSTHWHGRAYRYVLVGPAGVWCVLTTIDGRDLYRVQLIGAHDTDVGSQDLDDVLRRCLGEGVEYRIEDVSTWVRKTTVADRFRDGRVFLAGDAAHAHPPNGGLGMNTGILDAWDLGWKLAAVIDGWGGPTLLESYDWERRPACARATEESLRNYARLVDVPAYGGLELDTPQGKQLRDKVGAQLVFENARAWHPVGIHLSHVYLPSPVVADDGSEPPKETGEYEPSARPGARAPHAWLADGRSTLDLFGKGFTLLQFASADATPIQRAAAQRRVPLEIHRIDNSAIAALYERALVLVRPDGHVAWRGDACPEDAGALVDRVRGARMAVAARRTEDRLFTQHG